MRCSYSRFIHLSLLVIGLSLLTGCNVLFLTEEDARAAMGDSDGDGYTVCGTDQWTPSCDCDDSVYDNKLPGQVYYEDIDEDGYGDKDAVKVACTQPEGYVSNSEDCNVLAESIHPKASERCNGVDDDCDSTLPLDEQDNDRDGFMACNGSGSVPDCDDKSPLIHPNAKESCNSLDDDCDGKVDELIIICSVDDVTCASTSDELPAQSSPDGSEGRASIQAAINDAHPGQTVLVQCPGTFQAPINFGGKAITVKSLWGPDKTIIDGAGGTPVVFVNGETRDAVLEGFTIQNGNGVSGGGISIASSAPTLRNLIIKGNRAAYGGGLMIVGGLWDIYTLLEHVTITDNIASSIGGGVYTDSAVPIFNNCFIINNLAAYVGGGGLGCRYCGLRISNSVIEGNRAEKYDGGGILLKEAGSLFMYNSAVLNNEAAGVGGAIAVIGYSQTGASAHILNSIILQNRSVNTDTGGVYVDPEDGGYPKITAITNSILAYNQGYNFFDDPSGGQGSIIEYSCLYNPGPIRNHNLSQLSDTNVTVEPGFLNYSLQENVLLPDDFHLKTTSPLRDLGTTTLSYDPGGNLMPQPGLDADGSPTDLGIYGGTYGGTYDASWDLDFDGYPDYFWPGTFADAPDGIDSSQYDCNDQDYSIPLEKSCTP